MERPHTLTWKEAKLSAIWHYGRRSDAPIVIFHHGFGGTKVESHRLFVKCARHLAAIGIDSLRFDFYGAGDSEGSLTDATLSIWIENSLEAVSFVKSKGSRKVILLGFSLGGFVAAAAAPRVKPIGLCLWAPILHPLKRILREKNLVKQARESGFADYEGEVLKPSLIEDAARFTIPKAYKGYAGPVCVIYGTRDESALPRESRRFAQFYKTQGSPTELHGIREANHSFDRHDWETEVMDHTMKWISRL